MEDLYIFGNLLKICCDVHGMRRHVCRHIAAAHRSLIFPIIRNLQSIDHGIKIASNTPTNR